MGRRKHGEQHTEVATSATPINRTRAAGWAAAGALGMLAVLLLATSSSAAGPTARRAAASSGISACYNDRSGALRRIAAGRKCSHGETSISWLVVGLTGGGGEAGPMGPMGLRGAEGIPGAPGATVAGSAGSQGVQGPPGERGLQGLAGATGPSGAAGSIGAQGPKGPSGATGATGLVGATGPAVGSTGPTGATGAPGTAGGTLPSGQTERGEWTVRTIAAPEAGREAAGAISFPVALETPPTAVHHFTAKQTEEMNAGTLAEPGCIATAAPHPNLLEEPVAEPGNLCVYTGQEEISGTPFKNIQNTKGEPEKASRNGAFVTFESAVSEASNNVQVSGSWAVTAG